jgi:hypothetical protein
MPTGNGIAQRVQVVDGVGSAPGEELRFAVQNQHGASRDARFRRR